MERTFHCADFVRKSQLLDNLTYYYAEVYENPTKDI
jgi:hypothetical protein